MIKTGAVRLYTDDQAQQVTLALLGPDRMFGLSSTMGTARPRIGATTLEPSYICFASLPRLLEVLVRNPQVLLRMTLALRKQVFQAETWIEHTTGRSPCSRLADLLLELCTDFGEASPQGQRVKFRLTQADLARMINVSRETVNRVLAEFTDAGWVTRDDGLLVIQDQQALTAVAAEKHDRHRASQRSATAGMAMLMGNRDTGRPMLKQAAYAWHVRCSFQ